MVVAGISIGLGVAHFAIAKLFSAWLKSGEDATPRHDDISDGKAVIVVALRGRDPSLAAMLEALAQQTYPDYRVQLVIDGFSDEDWDWLDSLIENQPAPNLISVQALRDPPNHCGLKCAALSQALGQISGDCEYVAFIDADIIPHNQWLAEIVQPLKNPEVGVATGLQWFEPAPKGTNMGSWARALWNTVAIVPSAWAANVWAGSMACRRTDIERVGLEHLWQRSMVDDGPMKSAFSRHGLRVSVCRQLLMINREACSMRYTMNYMARSLTWSRLYERSFWGACVAATFVTLLLTYWLVTALTAVVSGNWVGIWVLLTSAIVGCFFSWVGFQTIRHAVAHSSHHVRSMPLVKGHRRVVTVVKQWILIVILHFLFPWAVWRAATSRHVSWRGVRYRIRSPFDIERLDHPDLPAAGSSVSEYSLE